MLNQNFIDILSAFSEEKVEFMVVGGYAVAFHGFVRGTGDFDLWIRISGDNAERVWKALVSFGAPLFDLKKDDLKTSGMVFQMGMPPYRIDIINAVDGIDFDGAWPNCSFVEVSGLKIPVIAKSDLLRNKRTMDRPKDQADIIWLESE